MTAAVQYTSTQGRGILLTTVLASGAAFLDMTVVVVALPRMGADLDAGFSGLQWVLDAYLLTLGSLVLLGGGLGDLLGRKRIFEIGMLGFLVASLACGIAPNTEVLIAARALQGVFAALMTPASLAIVSASFEPVDRMRAIGAWAGMSGVASAIGPFIGGWLTDAVSWRWVFLLNLPLIAAAMVVARRAVPDDPGLVRTGARQPVEPGGWWRRLDLAGGLLTVVGLGLIVAPLIEGHRLPTGLVVASVVAGFVLLGVFVWYEHRRAAPMLPPRLFAIRSFTIANLVTLVVYGALSAQAFLLSLTLQRAMGYSALAAGAASVPVTVLLLLFSSRVGVLARRTGTRTLLTIGPLIAAAGIVLLSDVAPGDSYLTGVLPGVVVFGVGLVLVVTPVTSTALTDVPGGYQGVASGTNNAVARVAGLLAIAVLPLAGGLSTREDLGTSDLVTGFRGAMLLAAACCALGGLVAWLGLRGLRSAQPASRTLE